MVSKLVTRLKNWWLFLVLGVLMLIGGFWVISTPVASYVALAWLFGVLVLADGIFLLIVSLSNTSQMKGWGWYLAAGIMELVIGFYLVGNPEISMAVLPFVVGFWLLFRGISAIASSIDAKDAGTKGWGWILTLGILLTIIAFMMIFNPVFGALNIVFLTSFALIFLGITYIFLSFKLKKIKSKTIDVVKEGKENAADLIKELRQKLQDHKDKIPADVADKLNSSLENYENKLKG